MIPESQLFEIYFFRDWSVFEENIFIIYKHLGCYASEFNVMLVDKAFIN